MKLSIFRKTFSVGFLVSFIPLLVARLVDNNRWLDRTPEQFLGIPFDIHHDLIGLVFVGLGLYNLHRDRKLAGLFIGLGLGMFLEHLLFEGVRLVTY